MTTRRQASLDDDLSAPAPARKGPRGAHAVIVGINEYEDARIRNLSFARRDAEVLAEILRDPSLGRFPEGNVSLLLDGDATRRNIVSAIGTQLRRAASPDDLVCVFFAGHGATDPDPGARSNDGLAKYLLPHDADLDDLFSSALPMQDVERFFNRIAARQIVFFLDACYSGGADTFATRSVLTPDFLEKLAGGGEGRLVLTSCRPNEVSLEDAAFGGGHGLYSHYLLRGLQGEADTDGDGFVSLDELYDYLQRNVSDHARRIGGSMSPIRTGSVQGEIFLTSYTTVAQREGDALAEEGARLIVSDNLGEATAVLQRALELVPGHVAAMAALATVDATLRRRRRVLVELNREGRLSDAVLDDALDLLRSDPGKLSGDEAFYREKVVALSEARLSVHAFLDVWSTRGRGMTAELPGSAAPLAASGEAEASEEESSQEASAREEEAPLSPVLLSALPMALSPDPDASDPDTSDPDATPEPAAEDPAAESAAQREQTSSSVDQPSTDSSLRRPALSPTRSSWVKPVAIVGGVVAAVTLALHFWPSALATAPEITEFRASASSVAAGDQVALSWRTTDADSVVLSPGGGTRATQDSAVLSPTQATDYHLTAYGAGGEARRSLMVEVSADAGTPPAGANDPLNKPIWVKGGTFQMGSVEEFATPVHTVAVSGFWMQQHEVTNAEFQRFDGTHRFPAGQGRYPVSEVTWSRARDYAASRGGRLPTEAEWEFAARGPEGRRYPWGNAALNCTRAQYDSCKANSWDPGIRLPVMSKPAGATPDGIHDLAGNVAEWISDWYGDYDDAPARDPKGPASGAHRVLRGGTFGDDSRYMASAWRHYFDPLRVGAGIGFRVVWSAAGRP